MGVCVVSVCVCGGGGWIKGGGGGYGTSWQHRERVQLNRTAVTMHQIGGYTQPPSDPHDYSLSFLCVTPLPLLAATGTL